MTTCIWYASDREKITMDEWQAIQELEKYIYKVAQNKGFLNMSDFNKYWDEISKVCFVLFCLMAGQTLNFLMLL